MCWVHLEPRESIEWLLHERFGTHANVHTLGLVGQRGGLPADASIRALAKQLVAGVVPGAPSWDLGRDDGVYLTGLLAYGIMFAVFFLA